MLKINLNSITTIYINIIQTLLLYNITTFSISHNIITPIKQYSYIIDDFDVLIIDDFGIYITD